MVNSPQWRRSWHRDPIHALSCCRAISSPSHRPRWAPSQSTPDASSITGRPSGATQLPPTRFKVRLLLARISDVTTSQPTPRPSAGISASVTFVLSTQKPMDVKAGLPGISWTYHRVPQVDGGWFTSFALTGRHDSFGRWGKGYRAVIWITRTKSFLSRSPRRLVGPALAPLKTTTRLLWGLSHSQEM